MKVKVIQGFRDKHTGERYHPGRILDISEKRLGEIKAKNNKLVEEVTENMVFREELKEMKVAELREMAKEMKINDSGKKEELIEKILSAKAEGEKREEINEGEITDEESEN